MKFKNYIKKRKKESCPSIFLSSDKNKLKSKEQKSKEQFSTTWIFPEED